MFYEEIMCQLLLLSLSALCSQLKAFDALETISLELERRSKKAPAIITVIRKVSSNISLHYIINFST